MPLLPSSTAPYGPLQSLHEHIIATAQPVNLLAAHHLLLYPTAPLFLQAYLLQYPRTRKYRIPLGIASIYFTVVAWMGYRFYERFLNAGNNLIGVMLLHLIGKAVEFALLEDPVLDPFAAKGRGRFMSAFDLSCNSRWIGLRPVNILPGSQPVSKESKDTSQRSTSKPMRPSSNPLPSDESWMAPRQPPRTRRQAFFRHLRLALTHLLIFDVLLNLLRYFGAGTVGQPHVPSGGVEKFFSAPYILLPRTRFAYRAPSLLVDMVVRAFIGGGVYVMLIGGYHVAAAGMVGLGIYEVEAWGVDLFNDPNGAGSVLEFWGKGWHQIFRHHFNLVSTYFVHIFNLPRLFLLPIAFGLSGALHALGQLSMSPSPDPTALFLFFLVQSFGCLAEIGFKRLTGRRVGGWAGWAWKSAFMALTAGVPLRTELESGLGGTKLFPDIGVGRALAGLIVRYIVNRP